MKRVWFVVLLLAAPLSAQSVLYRSPNLGGTWVPDAAVVQFNFIHRFYVFPSSSGHAVVNFPTFTLATGLGRRMALGAHFGTRAVVNPAAISSNETELFARWRAWGAGEGREGLGLAVTPAYNFLSKSADAEVSVDWTRRFLTLEGAVRGVSKPGGVSGKAQAALAGGFVARLSRYVAVSGDVGSYVSPTPLAAWSVGLDFVIPGTPHTFTLEMSNAATSSIEGNSRGGTPLTNRLYGFEFTIPLHLSRFSPWFHPHRQPQLPEPVTPSATAPADAVVHIRAFKYQTDTVTIAVGQTVGWVNDDPVAHAVVIESGNVNSGLIPQGAAFRHTFATAGTFVYHCTPHPYMKAVVVVK
ncbi:MAG TPA: cupredoxin family copper-binding protein [Gemmatimonadales bacterium]|nr:cupredoxin family copper-binding protein [Gemmatimonadales bacterium]